MVWSGSRHDGLLRCLVVSRERQRRRAALGEGLCKKLLQTDAALGGHLLRWLWRLQLRRLLLGLLRLRLLLRPLLELLLLLQPPCELLLQRGQLGLLLLLLQQRQLLLQQRLLQLQLPGQGCNLSRINRQLTRHPSPSSRHCLPACSCPKAGVARASRKVRRWARTASCAAWRTPRLNGALIAAAAVCDDMHSGDAMPLALLATSGGLLGHGCAQGPQLRSKGGLILRAAELHGQAAGPQLLLAWRHPARCCLRGCSRLLPAAHAAAPQQQAQHCEGRGWEGSGARQASSRAHADGEDAGTSTPAHEKVSLPARTAAALPPATPAIRPIRPLPPPLGAGAQGSPSSSTPCTTSPPN